MTLFAGHRDAEEITDSRLPVQEIPRTADENARSVSTVLCALHQTQRVQTTTCELKSLYNTCVYICVSVAYQMSVK